MRFLKTNTATRVTVGPFLDKTDGITPEVALTATNEKLTLMVDGGGVPTLVLDANATASGGSNDLVHVTGDDAGFYDLELTAAQTNYLGRAMLAITYSTDHCPVFHEFQILTANAYDSLFSTDLLQVDLTQIAGAAVSTSTAQLGVNVVSSGAAAGVTSFKKNTAKSSVMLYMELTAGGPATAKTVTVQVSKDGGAFANITFGAGTATEVSNGFYKFDLSATELNADVVALKATATACNQTSATIFTQV